MCCGVHGFAKINVLVLLVHLCHKLCVSQSCVSSKNSLGKTSFMFLLETVFLVFCRFFFVPVTAVYCCVCLCFLFLTWHCSIHLYIDSVDVQILWRLFCQELFYCHGLRKLTVSDNDLISIPPAVASLANFEHLDFSKDGNWFTFIVIILQCNKHTVVKILSHFLRCIVLNSLGLVLAVFLM